MKSVREEGRVTGKRSGHADLLVLVCLYCVASCVQLCACACIRLYVQVLAIGVSYLFLKSSVALEDHMTLKSRDPVPLHYEPLDAYMVYEP